MIYNEIYVNRKKFTISCLSMGLGFNGRNSIDNNSDVEYFSDGSEALFAKIKNFQIIRPL